MRIVPAILTNDHDELLRQLDYIEEFTDEVDIDVMDGIFVLNKSCEIKELPVKNNLIYNFDLMVKNPIDYINQILDRKIHENLIVGRIFVHTESEFDLSQILNLSNNFHLGFTLSLQTAVENFISIYKSIQSINSSIEPSVQLMTVQIGGQGNAYHPEVLAKVQLLRQNGFKGEIYLDGGIDPEVIASIKNYDISGVSVGSYISRSSNPMQAFNNLKDATWKKIID